MKILQIHNFHRQSIPSGEDTQVRADRQLLDEAGHHVHSFYVFNDAVESQPLRTLHDAIKGQFWNTHQSRRVRLAARAKNPDIIHIHNTFPLLSPAVIWQAQKLAPTVVTLHNYRSFCLNGLALRNSQPCTDCLGRKMAWPGIRHGCYRGHAGSALVASSLALHRLFGSFAQADALIAVSSSQRDVLIADGFPEDRLYVKANHVPSLSPPRAWEARDKEVLYVGRLSPEKGVDLLLEAWNHWGTEAPRLTIVGDGPLRDSLEAQASRGAAANRIEFMGSLPRQATLEMIARCRLLINPSRALETGALTVVEALSLGVPVIGAPHGAQRDLVRPGETGALAVPLSAETIRLAAQSLWNSPTRMRELSLSARRFYTTTYAPSAGLAALEAVYRRAQVTHQARQHDG